MGGDIRAIEMVSHWGFIGVDIFFVISGFIMAYTAFSKSRSVDSAKIFFKHRLFRIYLGYWPFFFMALLLTYITNPDKLPSLDIIGSFWLVNIDMYKLLLPISWSLGYELYFYFLFLFTFLFSIERLRYIIPTIFGSLLLISTLSHLNIVEDSFFYSSSLLEFFGGVLLYQFREYLMGRWVLAISIILVVASYTYGIEYELKNGLYRVASFGVGAIFLTLVFLIIEYRGVYSANRYAIALGDASYTLYLSHIIIINLLFFTGVRDIFATLNLPLLGLFNIFAITIIFSLIYYKYIEKPLYRRAIKGV
jgi:peptidoglycan/LPS O-acetylase OafA/YrhL